jgi:hypothetical protein
LVNACWFNPDMTHSSLLLFIEPHFPQGKFHIFEEIVKFSVEIFCGPLMHISLSVPMLLFGALVLLGSVQLSP